MGTYGSFNYNFQVMRPNNREAIKSGLKVQIYSAGTTSATIYADSSNTAKTNPISITTFDALETGVINFWCNDTSVNVGVFDKFGNSQLFRDVTAKTHSLMFLQNGPDKALSCEFFDDFLLATGLAAAATTDGWVFASDAGGTFTVDDAVNGVASILTGGTDEDASTLSSIDQTFLVDTDKNIYFEARVKCTEGATSAATHCIGLADIVTTDLMQDNKAGPADTLDGIIFYKLEANMYWEFECSNGALTDVDISDMVAYASGTWYTLAFFVDYNDGTTAKVTPYVNGVAYETLDLVISGMLEMNVVLHTKTAGTRTETLKVDYVRVVQDRDD